MADGSGPTASERERSRRKWIERRTSVISRERLVRLPKAELHVHLDGSLRAATLLELATAAGIALPHADEARLAGYMAVQDARDLVDYLKRFDITTAVLQDAAAIERVAYELAADAAAENVRYLEVRFSPVLCTRVGLNVEDAIAAAVRGLVAARRDHRVRAAVIVCALRDLEPPVSEMLADVAASFARRGVVGFDLAGPERGHPAAPHAAAFRRAARAGLGLTVHAGEAVGPASIREAIDACGARRIGHGTTLIEDATLLRRVRDEGIAVEACITSNVQTRAVASVAEHPAKRMHASGVSVSLSTDNRLISGTTLTAEYERAAGPLAMDWPAIVDLARGAFEAAFLPEAERASLLESFDHDVAALQA